MCLHWEQEIERGCTTERREVEREGDRDAQMKRDSAAVRETLIAKEYEADRESVQCILTFISALLEEVAATFSICNIFIFGPIPNLQTHLLSYYKIFFFFLLSSFSLLSVSFLSGLTLRRASGASSLRAERQNVWEKAKGESTLPWSQR